MKCPYCGKVFKGKKPIRIIGKCKGEIKPIRPGKPTIKKNKKGG